MENEGRRKSIITPTAILFVVVCIVVFLFLTTQISLRRASYGLKVGDVASKDLTAPRTITYVSDILTEEARRDAADNVNNIYLPADPTISRNQVQNLRYTFQYINVVRNDEYSTRPQKVEDINAIEVTEFDEGTVNQLLDLTAEDWAALQEESLRILENVMQNSIRETQVNTEIANIPAMINYYINQPISSLVTIIVSRFVTANSLYSEELTEKSKEEAAAAVQPRERTFVINQTVIQKGQIVTELIYEALNKMGLVVSQNNPEKYTSVICIILGLAAFFFSYLHCSQNIGINGFKNWLVVSVLFLLYFIVGRLVTPNHTLIPYFFPASALGLTIASLYGVSPAFMFSILLSILIPYDFANAVIICVYYMIGSLASVILLGKHRSIGSFMKTGILSGIICVPIVISYQFVNASYAPDMTGLLSISGASVICGIATAALSLVSHYLISGWIGITTPTHLMEILRPDAPLLQVLLQSAPGTYQHSLQVSNLAEQAARDIGADSLLTKVGAMYHDVGKTMNPFFFVENQASGNLNLHDDMTPQESSAMIMKHVTDGIDLIHQYHLPERIADFVREHHGTNVTRFQYGQACELNGEENVDIKDFTYPGPIPSSKETALVMLADSVEARARAERPANNEQIAELVKSVFDNYSTAGQMDNTPLTFRDLSTARQSFERVLKNIYHPRVRYPELKKKKDPEPGDEENK